LLLIALVVLLFLQGTRGTVIVAFSKIPLGPSAVTLIVLYATGNTLNCLTLGGLKQLAMGPLVGIRQSS